MDFNGDLMGFNSDLMGCNGDLMGFNGDLMGFDWDYRIPSGKLLHNYGKSPCSMGKSTISMAIFNSKQLSYQRVCSLHFIAVWLGY